MARVVGFALERETGDVPWRVYMLLDAWPHRSHFSGFYTKRAAQACVRILEAGSVNAADAITIVQDQIAHMKKRIHGRQAEGIVRSTVENFAIQYSFNAGLPFPDLAVFRAHFPEIDGPGP